MEILNSRKIMSLLDGDTSFRPLMNQDIRSDRGVLVQDFPDLVEKVAQLSFHNPEQVLLFRGQSKDWRNSRENTTIKPSIFRSSRGVNPPSRWEMINRYRALRVAEQRLAEKFSENHFLGSLKITRYRLVRWAILQHYEVCATPLLDVTHSLRVSSSFATNTPSNAEPVLYVIGVPALSGSITASSEQGIQIIRLSSICPPDARRPYFQEGYLLAEYPDLSTFSDNAHYRPQEIDFARRLLAKFRLSRSGFWSKSYPPIPDEALYPNERDPLIEVTKGIKSLVMT